MVYLIFLLFASINLFAQQKQTTFNQNIAPIIHQNCSYCHSKNNTAPFALITYAEVKSKSGTIEYVLKNGVMPPWVPDKQYRHFINERAISEEEKNKVLTWINNGMPEGKGKIKYPEYYEGSYYGKPDYVIKMKPYKLNASTEERFIMDVIPFQFDKDTFVKAFEFVPGNKQLIHHCNQELNAIKTDNLSVEKLYFSGWTPGFFNMVYPDGIGFKFPKEGLLRLNHHYSASSVDTTIQSYINVFFAKKPVERTIKYLTIGGIEMLPHNSFIPADTIITYHITKTIETDISVLAIYPHMHVFGENLVSFAITPQQDTINLIKINKWRFDWQEIYALPKLLKLPKGTVVHSYFTYNNTASNILNPHNPTRPIHFEDEMTSLNEMINIFLSYVEYKEGDENIPLKSTIYE